MAKEIMEGLVKTNKGIVKIVGYDGATFVPHISDDYVLSWTNDHGLENPDPVQLPISKGEISIGEEEPKEPNVLVWIDTGNVSVKYRDPETGTFAEVQSGGGTDDGSVKKHNVSETAHNDIRLLLAGLSERLNAIADSDDTTLDQLSEIVAYIKANKTLIESITTSKVNVSDIIDNLTTSVSNKPLSAKMGVELRRLISTVENSANNAMSQASSAQSMASSAMNHASSAEEMASSAMQRASSAEQMASAAQTEIEKLKENGVPGGAGTSVEEIHIGADEPTDGEKLWIDPEDDGDGLTAEDIEAALGYTPANAEAISDLPNNETLIGNVAKVVKAEVPLVKTAQQPTFVDSVDKMTDTSKVYIMPDGYMWAYTFVGAEALTANDFVVTNVLSDGSLEAGSPRIATKNLLPCDVETVSISCPSPYQYFIYFYTDNDTSTYIGKTTWVSGDIDDVLNATVGSGTSSGAKYCRISLRDSTNPSAILDGRINEFMLHITVKQGTDSQSVFANTGHLYVQPAEKPFYTLQGKNIACFGDSLAANCYVGNVKQWIERVGEFFQCGKIYNRGVGGSAVSSINGSGNERNNYAAFNEAGEAYLRISYKTGEAPMEIPEGYTEMKASMELDERVNTIPLDTDILLIEAGTNDNDLDADKLAAAYDRMLVKIQNRIPNAKIIILGLPFVNPRIYETDNEREYLRNKLEELMTGIRQVAKKYGIPVIELKDTAQVNLLNYTNYMSNDALHYDTEAGTKRWAETVIKGMFGVMFL